MSALENAVYTAIEERILSGEFHPGEPLTEARITEITGASRTPVRDALHRLERDGLVRIEPNRGAFVIGLTRADLADIYEVRRRVEGLAARRAAEHVTEDDKKTLLEIVEMQEFFVRRGGDRLKELDSAFHDRVYALCGSHVITSTIARLHRQSGLFRKRSMHSAGRAEAMVAEHRAIYEAIARGDGDAAEQLTVCHVQNAYLNLLNILED